MPQRRQETEVNKEALNALTDLYYLYSDLATHLREYTDSPQEIDLFFLRPGGLKELLIKYYELASTHSGEAGSPSNLQPFEHMLPRDTSIGFYRAHDDLWRQIVDMTDVIKGYNTAQGAVGTPVPQEVTEVVNEGRHIIARRKQRSRSGADDATVDLASADISYEDHNLIIGTKKIDLESESLMDMVTRCMVLEKRKGEQVYLATISTWIESESNGQLGEPSGRAVKDAIRAVNKAVRKELDVEENFFDTSIRHRVIRRY
tara:strand:- start:1157 stop:1936 length:780 start_codon:yes stop_codon:yes gene_type:complete